MRAFRLGLLGVLGLGALACEEQTRFLSAPWPSDHSKVLIVIDEQQGPESAQAYGPGEPIVLQVMDDHPKRLLVFAYPASTTPDTDPVACGVVLDDSNPVLLPLEGVYQTASVDLGSNAALEFTPVDPKLSELPKFGYLRCSSDPVNCNTLLIQRFDTPAVDRDAERLAVVSDDVVFFAASTDPNELNQSNSQLFRFDRSLVDDPLAFRRLEAPTSTAASITGLAYDGASVLAVTLDGQLRRYDPTSGVLLGLEPVPERLARISARAGVRLHYGLGGLVASGAPIAPITGVQVYDAILVGPERALAVSDRGLQYWDGRSWSMSPGPESPYAQVHVAADASTLVAVTQLGGIFERVGAAEHFSSLDRLPGAGITFTSAVAISEGRYLIGGKNGLLHLRNKVGLCSMSTFSNNTRAMVLAPSGRYVWIGSSNFGGQPGDTPPLLRIELP